jgi:hypothetical protein
VRAIVELARVIALTKAAKALQSARTGKAVTRAIRIAGYPIRRLIHLA